MGIRKNCRKKESKESERIECRNSIVIELDGVVALSASVLLHLQFCVHSSKPFSKRLGKLGRLPNHLLRDTPENGKNTIEFNQEFIV
jgi:hypothetical protein